MTTPARSFPCWTLILSGLAAIGAVAAADGPGQGRPAAGLPPVALDFRAVAEDGRPILDLAPDSLTLKVDGDNREIRSVQVFDFGRPAAGTEPPVLRPPFASNVIADGGRDVFLLIDDESIAPGREDAVRSAVEELLGALAPRDRVGVVTVPQSGGTLGFTSRHDEVRALLASFTGRAPRAATPTDIACRTRLMLNRLKDIFANHQADVATAVILLSSRLAGPSSSPTMPRGSVATSDVLCEVRTTDFNDVAEAAFGSRADFHVGYLAEGSDLAASADLSGPAAGLESLAGVTGSQLLRLTGAQTGTMARLARETSAHYVLMFEPDRSESDGRSHRVELRTARSDVLIRVRPRVVIPKASDRPRADADVTAREMLRVAAVHRDLPLRAAGYAARDLSGKQVKVIAVFEPAAATSQLDTAMIGLFDGKGKLTAQWTGQKSELVRPPVLAALLVAPGVYRMRVAATDLAGRAGSVDVDLRAALVDAPPVKLSALTLGAVVDGAFAPRILFADEQVVVGYVEVYGAPKGAAVTAEIELAESEDQAPAIKNPARVPAASGGDVQPIFGGVQIDRLPPGDYSVRMVVSVGGRPVGRVLHTLRKRGR